MIVKNFWLQNNKKRIANSVIYKNKGRDIGRSLAASVANPRTESQMIQLCEVG